MAASRATRLAPVVEMAEKVERAAVQRLGHFQGQVRLAETKLAELDRQGVSGQWLMNYQRFLNQLETAVAQQRKSLAWHETNLATARAAWQQAYARVEGLRKLVQRYIDEARALEDKREQRLLDELSQRLPRHDAL
jgi:flagellar FliJ protein